MLKKTYTPEDTEKRGQAIFNRRVLPMVNRDEKGEFVVIDVATEEYEIDRRHADAIARLLKRLPEAEIFTARVGYPIPYQPRWPRLRPAEDD